MRMTGARYIAEAFKAYGITHFFYVPVIIPEAVKEMTRLGITPVMTHGEKAAAYMADGFARISHHPGVCGAQTIGGTNLAAGLRDAFLARVPVVAICGGKLPQRRYRFVYQEIDDMPIYQAITKFNATVERLDRLPDLLRAAFRSATSGMPQPVHLELPGQAGEIVNDTLEFELDFDTRFGEFPSVRTPAPSEDVDRVLAALRTSERPIIVAGGGVASSGAQMELVELARRLGIPVATSLNGKGVILDTDPLSIGVVGEYSRRCANQAVSQADLVFYIGSLTGGLVTRNWSVPDPSARVVHLDINPENLGRNYADTVGICGDARTVLRQLLGALEQPTPSDGRQPWRERVAELRADWQASVRAYEASDAVPMRPERLCREISEWLPEDAIVVADTGHAGAWLAQDFYATSPRQTFIRAHGSLGWGLPAAIGAKCAAPSRPVVCFTGDGGLFYHFSELETAARYGINVTVVVNNNRSLNQEQRLWKESTDFDKNWRFCPVDFASAARAFGCLATRVEQPAEIRPALDRALSAERTTLIEAMTDLWVPAAPSWGPE
jgi:acetolactate synthase I/II/III large subunit